MHKPRRIWLWFRVLAVVTLGLLVLPLLSTPAGADGGYDGPSQPVGTQAAQPQPDGTGAGAPATSDTTSTSDSRSTDGLTGPDTGSAGTTGAGPAFAAPASTASSSTAPAPALGSTASSDTSAPVANNTIVVRKHADTVTGELIDKATFQLWIDVNRIGVLDTPSASTSSTSTSSTASLTTPSSATSPAAVDTPTGAATYTAGGTATWPALPAGKYLVQEVAAPSGYQLPSANDSPVDFPSSSPGQTKTVDFADVKLSSSPTATATTSTPSAGAGAVSVAPPAGTTTGGGTLPGVGAPAHLLLAGLVGLASLAGGGWLLSRRRPRGAHAQP